MKEKKKRSAPKYWIKKNGSLYARLQYQDDTGKMRDKYKKITDKRKARSVVEKMRRELDNHGSNTLQSDKVTFDILVDKYKETKLIKAVYADGVKVSGRRSIKPIISSLNVLGEFFGKKRIRSINLSDIERYKDHRLKTPVVIVKNNRVKLKESERTGRKKFKVEKVTEQRPRKISSVNRELETLRAMLNFAIENDWLIKNPFYKKKGIISKASENERDRVLSHEEEAKLLLHCVDQRTHIKPILICALDTAMRRGEIFKMKWQDINLETGEIFIPQTNTKTDAERTVGMTSRLKEELLKLWNESPKEKDLLVFGITNSIKTAWKTLCNKSDVEDFRFHDCRHTATTRMISSGSGHTEVMKITGHTQLKTFLRYLNITPETSRKIANNLDEYLQKTNNIELKVAEYLQ